MRYERALMSIKQSAEAGDIHIDRLTVTFSGKNEPVTALKNVSLTLPAGRITGIIGESGSGKSVLAMSLLGLLPKGTSIEGDIRINGRKLNEMKASELRKHRQESIALIPQDPENALNPVVKIDRQIREALPQEPGKSSPLASVLASLGLSDKAKCFPFQLSGGMKQRALAAMAIYRYPSWLLADEPTKGLDPSLRSRVYKLLTDARHPSASGMIIITHDLPFARRICDDVAVFYCGRIMEVSPAKAFFSSPCHPYPKALLKSLPQAGLIPVPGPVPGIAVPPEGCPFHPRCPERLRVCRDKMPEPTHIPPGRTVYCHRYV